MQEPNTTQRPCREGHFVSWDGTELFCRTWAPTALSDKAVILIHRGHEHSGRLQLLVDELGLDECWAFAWDARGHGRSPGDRGYAARYDDLVRDLDAFVRHVVREHGLRAENIVLLANSVGAVTAAAWVHDYAPRIRGMVLAAPALRIRLYVPLAIPMLRLLQRVRPRANISSYVKSKMLTHDPEQSRSYDADPLITRNIAVNVLLGLHDTATRVMADAGAITTPTLVLSAGSDWVVKNSAQHRFFDGLSSEHKERALYPGFFHALLYEQQRHWAIERARAFIRSCFDRPEEDRAPLLHADREGYTRREYEALQRPAPFPRNHYFALQKAALRVMGRLSDGVRLGLETGFDSGQTLDYVYENRPRGRTALGRWIDRAYLNAVGWKGIRRRGENLQALLRQAVEEATGHGGEARILDIATGCGRYVLEVLKAMPGVKARARLRDFAERNVEAGRKLAETLGLENVEFEQGDAFDPASILGIGPRPNIAIVSGLYELFPENEPVLASLQAVAEVLEPGGVLLYTGQPWHPQIELIARTCTNREGKPWIMRRRTQAELDELVRSVGLEKERMEIDEFGIFTVSVARKPLQPSG